jgi:hypothetical protein
MLDVLSKIPTARQPGFWPLASRLRSPNLIGMSQRWLRPVTAGGATVHSDEAVPIRASFSP